MNRGEIRAVFFDVFGTLILYPEGKYSAAQFAGQAARLDLSITADEFAAALDILKGYVKIELQRNDELARMEREDRRAYWEWWYGELLRLVGVKQNIEEYALGMFVEYIFDSGFTLDPEAPILLESLRPYFTLGIISNAPVRLWEILNREGLSSPLDVVVISSEVGAEKPDREIFEIALKRVGLVASKAIYVGDSLVADILSAEKAGLVPILIDRDCRHPNTTYQRIQSLLELKELLDC